MPVQKTSRKDFHVHIGAPDAIVVRYRAGGSGGSLVAFDSTLTFTYRTPSASVSLGVGSGISLSLDEGVANARATIQLSVAQSRAIPPGSLTTYELQRIVGGREKVLLMGKLIAEGGGNPDGA